MASSHHTGSSSSMLLPPTLDTSLTRQALRDELQRFAEVTLRQELQDCMATLHGQASSGLNQMPMRQRPAPLLKVPDIAAGDADDGESDLDSDKHEWTFRHMRRYRSHDLLCEEDDDDSTRTASTTPATAKSKPVADVWQVGRKVIPKFSHRIGTAKTSPDLLGDAAGADENGRKRPSPIDVAPDQSGRVDDAKQSSEPQPSGHCVQVSHLFTSTDHQLTGLESGWRVPIKKLVRMPAFDYVMGILVLINSALIGIQTDVVARRNLRAAPFGFRVCETCFTIVFTVELLFRIIASWGRFFKVRSWHWNVFDCVIVGLQVTEEFVAIILYGYSSGESAMVNFSVVRIMRLLRFVRIIRLVRVMRLISEMRVLVTSITRSWRPLCWTLVLLMLNMYLVAVYFTQAVHEEVNTANINDDDLGDPQSGFAAPEAALRHYFGSLGMSFLSLFQAITGGKDWDDLSSPLLTSIGALPCFAFACYIAFTVIAMMNVVTGVFVENAIKSAKEDKDFFMINNMREVFKEANGGITGVMTWETFESQLDKHNMQEYFRAIDVDPSEAKGLFRLLDLDGSGFIDAEEFLSGCLRLRGPAKALDLALLMHEVRRMVSRIQEQKKLLQKQLSRLRVGEHGVSTLTESDRLSLISPTAAFDQRMAALTNTIARGDSEPISLGRSAVVVPTQDGTSTASVTTVAAVGLLTQAMTNSPIAAVDT